MKKKGSKFEYEHERDEALFKAYRTALTQCARVKKVEIFKVVATMPSPRFWVSEERAAIVVSRMMAGDTLDDMVPCKRAMFQEIYRRVMELHEQRPDDSVYDLTFDVVHQPAPSFYLTPGSIKTILFRIKKRRQQQHHRHR